MGRDSSQGGEEGWVKTRAVQVGPADRVQRRHQGVNLILWNLAGLT